MVDWKWLFSIKHKHDGPIDRCKACLVAMEFTHHPKLYHHSPFNLVVKQAIIRLIITTAIQLHWHVHYLDVNNAFLQGILTKEVYKRHPMGFENSGRPMHVCCLQKAIYRLK